MLIRNICEVLCVHMWSTVYVCSSWTILPFPKLVHDLKLFIYRLSLLRNNSNFAKMKSRLLTEVNKLTAKIDFFKTRYVLGLLLSAHYQKKKIMGNYAFCSGINFYTYICISNVLLLIQNRLFLFQNQYIILKSGSFW